MRHGSPEYKAFVARLAKEGPPPGLTLLEFSGMPAATMKPAAAELAQALGRRLDRIDLSRIVSKFVGETEKNLSRVIEQAAASSAVLCFDEGDALFGKRTEVKDSHDRYGGQGTAYRAPACRALAISLVTSPRMDAAPQGVYRVKVRFPSV